MMLKVFSLLDQKTGIFSPPFFMVHQAQAMRAVVELGCDPNTTVGRHPADFALCCLGEFDDNTGQFLAPAGVQHLGLVVQMLPPKAAPMSLFSGADSSLAPGSSASVSRPEEG